MITVEATKLDSQVTQPKSAKVYMYWQRTDAKWIHFCKVSGKILTRLTGKTVDVDPNTADMKFIQKMLDIVWVDGLTEVFQVKK